MIEKKLVEARRLLKQTKQMTKEILIKMQTEYEAEDKEKSFFLEKKSLWLIKICLVKILSKLMRRIF